MISMSCDKEKEWIELKVYGDDFNDTIEILKPFSQYIPSKKVRVAPLQSLETLKEELTIRHIDYDISDYDEQVYKDFMANFSELKVSPTRRKLDVSIMKFPPFEGKPPYENFQKQDISRALNQNRFLFNWEMGLGKSYALTVLIDNLRQLGLIDKVLIFSTSVGILNLKDEIAKFSTIQKPEDILVVSSLKETKYEDRDIFNTELYPQKTIIMAYDTFKGINNFYYDRAKGTKSNPKPSRSTKFRKSYIPMQEWLGGKSGGIFLDECHSLADPSSLRSKAFLMNLSFFDYRYLFTGTLADKYEKLYIPLKILDRELVNGYDYYGWLGMYNELGDKHSNYTINDDKWDLLKLEELNKTLLRKFAARRLMDECLDIPPDYDVPTIPLDMMPRQRAIYEGFIKEQIKRIKEREDKLRRGEKTQIINMFQVFQLAIDNPECIKGSDYWDDLSPELQKDILKYDGLKDSAKLDTTLKIVEERTDEYGERGILWYYHPVTKDNLVEAFKKYDPIVIEAGLTPEERTKRIKEFKENPKHKLIIGSINIMNTSITLIECKYQVYVECTYNYTIYSQSRGRIHRPNQDQETRTYSMCYNDSIDAVQKQNLMQKGAVINSLLNKEYIDQGIWRKIFNANLRDTWT